MRSAWLTHIYVCIQYIHRISIFAYILGDRLGAEGNSKPRFGVEKVVEFIPFPALVRWMTTAIRRDCGFHAHDFVLPLLRSKCNLNFKLKQTKQKTIQPMVSVYYCLFTSGYTVVFTEASQGGALSQLEDLFFGQGLREATVFITMKTTPKRQKQHNQWCQYLVGGFNPSEKY